MKVIKQHDVRDCGAACLGMIAAHYGYTESIAFFRELTKTDKSGTNLYGIIDAASQIGFTADALSGTLDELIAGIETKEIKMPFIAHIVSDGLMLHFIVIHKYKNGIFYAADPAKGNVKYSYEDFFHKWTGYIVTFETDVHFHTHKARKKPIDFFSLVREQKKILSGIIVLSMILSAIGILGSYVFKLVIDGSSEISVNRYFTIFVSLICLYILHTILEICRGGLIVSLSKKLDLSVSMKYYTHILKLPVSSINVRQTGEYLSRFSDIATIRNAIPVVTITLVMDSILVVGCGFLLFSINSIMFLVALTMVVIYSIIVLVFHEPIKNASQSIMENNAIVESYLKESLDGIETTKASNAETIIEKNTTEKYLKLLHSTVKGSMISISQESLSNGVQMIGTVCILWAGFHFVGKDIISLGELITFYALLAYFTEPIKNLIGLQSTIQTALIAAERLGDILYLSKEDHDIGIKEVPDGEQWKLEHVDFRYGNGELILNDVSFHIKNGEKIAIVGESGSGKTTIAKLLMRFYSPEKGHIMYGEHDISEFNLSMLRDKISYIDENTFLFSDTVLNNLHLAAPDATEEEIINVCKICSADQFIHNLPFGYDTFLDENGINLSGGQRQRLSIARALLKKPELLIMDEATSNLDSVTETAIKHAIFEVNKDLSCIIIAHRLSTIKECDRIYVMKDGAITECGTHEELIMLNGLYRKMWDSQ